MQFIYNIEPRVKILLIIFFSILILIIDKLPVAACLMLSFLAVRLAARIPFRSAKPWLTLSMLVLFLIFLQILFAPGEKYLVKPLFPPSFPLFGGMGYIKQDGLVSGLVIGCRLTALMLIMSVFTETTSPQRIALGLNAFGLNYRAAFIITYAFNLIPVFEEEGRNIIDAQKMRGMNSFEKKLFFAKFKAYPGLVVPLLLSAMRKARLAGMAMDTRAFGAYRKRTWIDKLSMKMPDYIVLAVCFCFITLVLYFNYR